MRKNLLRARKKSSPSEEHRDHRRVHEQKRRGVVHAHRAVDVRSERHLSSLTERELFFLCCFIFFVSGKKRSVSKRFTLFIFAIYFTHENYSKSTQKHPTSLSLSGYLRIRHLSPFPLDGALAKMCLKIGTPARRTEDRMRSNSGFASAHGPSIFIFNVRLANANESGVNVKKSPIVIPYAIIKLWLIISSIHAAIPCAENAVANEDALFALFRNCLRNGRPRKITFTPTTRTTPTTPTTRP